MVECEQQKHTARLRAMEFRELAFAQGPQFAGAAFDDVGGQVIGKIGGAGAGPNGIRKNVKIAEWAGLDEVHGGGVIFFRFAGETGDNVGADGSVRELFANEFDAAGVMFGAIPAVHGGENFVRGGLQRHVEVLGEPG